MELRHLKYFVAVAEELHFGRAAERLHIAQPPLSQQIRKLEDELGVILLARTRRKVELTPAGKLFLDEARLTLLQAERAKRIAQEVERGLRGKLRIGFVTSASYSILPNAIRRYRLEHPFIDIELLEMIPSRQIEALADGTIDAGLMRPPVGDASLHLERVLEEPLVAALPTGHRKARQKSIDLNALAEEPFVLFPRRHGPGIYDVIQQACQDAGFSPNISYEPNEMQTILAYVAGGLGISLVPQSMAVLHSGSITYLPLRGSRWRVGLSLARRTGPPCEALANFCRICGEVGVEYTSRIRKT